MRTTHKAFTVIISLLCSIMMHGQEANFKFGKVTQEEINMPVYQQDTTASAVVLNKSGDTYYTFVGEDFQVEYNYETRIKILKPEGTSYANIAIPYYQHETTNNNREQISKIEAYAYNLENGKVVKTKMEKEYIFEERISPQTKKIKFSIPAVKAGTVIEYRYRRTSNFYYNLKEWNIQEGIPVANAYYRVIIPEYLKFNIATKGFEDIKTTEEIQHQSFTINLGKGKIIKTNSFSRKLTFTSANVPALKDENHLWCVNDFMSAVIFELQGVQLPMSVYQPYTTSWEDIDETLKSSNSFGAHLSMKNPYPELSKLFANLPLTKEDLIKSIFITLKGLISWNGKYSLYADDIKKAVKNGTGTNAEFNFILLSALKDVGIEAYPILLSRKNLGRLPLTHPSIGKLNTFIVGAQDTDSTLVFIDGSIEYGSVNILPPVLLTDKARALGYNSWIDLTQIKGNSVKSMIKASVNQDGTINGSAQRVFDGQFAAEMSYYYFQAKDSTALIEMIQAESEIQIKDYQISSHLEHAEQVRDHITFSKTTTANGDFIYLNPMIIPHITQNSFTQEERKVPVEFPYPYTMTINAILTIPEGYQVEEMPQSIRFGMEDGSMKCTYTIAQTENQLTLNYHLRFNKITFTQAEYPTLKTYWETLVKKNTEQIVLKKTKL